MLRFSISIALLCAASAAQAGSPTNFGVREFGKSWDSPSRPEATPAVLNRAASPATIPGILGRDLPSSRIDLSSVARIGGQWGRVTSMRRSAERNRRVGGVANSYHLSGQAVDIARRPGVTGVPLQVSCGTSDPFADQTRVYRSHCRPAPAGGLSAGRHDGGYWRSLVPGQLRFVAEHLAAVRS